MKRCPECEFIHEDDETLCAMDGAALVNLSGPLPFEESVLPQSLPATHSQGRSLTLIAAGIILAVALALTYRNVIRQRGFHNLQRSPATYYAPSPDYNHYDHAAAPGVTATPFVEPSPAVDPTISKPNAPRKTYRGPQSEDDDPFRATPIPNATPSLKPSPPLIQIHPKTDTPANPVFVTTKPTIVSAERRTPSTTEKQTKPSAAEPKKESKFGSFLKKAGSVLKKPFKN